MPQVYHNGESISYSADDLGEIIIIEGNPNDPEVLQACFDHYVNDPEQLQNDCEDRAADVFNRVERRFNRHRDIP